MRSVTQDIYGGSGELPAGTIIDHNASAVPTGFLACDGSAISRGAFASLFSTIGTAFGSGDGATTFNLPDTRGRTVVTFVASGGHSDVSTLGNNDGVAASYRRAKHRHSPHTHGFGWSDGNNNSSGSSYAGPTSPNGYNTASVDGGSGNTSDSLDAPAYIVTNQVIKT